MSSNPLDKKSQAWSALFSEPMSELVQRYTASVGFDRRLWRADIDGSLAHAEMLAAQGDLGDDHAAIQRGMAQIAPRSRPARFEWKLELEDVHLNIEARLTQLVGDAGKRLHTGRSRNDQVATDVRLWLRGEIDRLFSAARADAGGAGGRRGASCRDHPARFTHMQVAQPVSFAHHLLAYVGDVRARCRALSDVRSA
jgi:argininosuccinate lyase